MTSAQAALRRANLTGGLWMVLSMAAFACEDALFKLTAQSLPVGQILLLFGGAGALVFGALAQLAGQPLFPRAALAPVMLRRAAFEVFGRLFYFLALVFIPLSTATVILQATPVAVVLAASLVFGEKVGAWRWSAILLGLLGVVVVVQPGVTGFDWLSLLAVAGMLGFAGRDLASRAADVSLSAQVLGFYGFLAVALAGVLYSFWTMEAYVLPQASVWLPLTLTVLTGVLAYFALMKAMRTGEVSAVTPFRYSRLLFGVGLGVVFFGEALNPVTLLGSTLIVVAGAMILRR